MQPIRSTLTMRTMPAGTKSCIFHGFGGWLTAITSGQHDVFHKLAETLIKDGVSIYSVEGGSELSKRLLESDHLNICVGGPAYYGPTTLHLHPSHVWGFWYFDELGTGWNSSLRFTRFNPSESDPRKARFFFDGVSGFFRDENVSKREQEARMKNPMLAAKAVVFCNEETGLPSRADYMSQEEMISTTARAAGDARVYVKAHPDTPPAARKKMEKFCARFDNIKVTGASIHDLIAASEMVVVQNSSVGFEALLHRKPVITCAKSDYWQATLTAKSVEDLVEALSHGTAALKEFDYEGYIYWYLEKQCIEPAKSDFEERVLGRILEKVMLA